MEPIVAGFDGTATAGLALDRAAEMALALGADLHVVSVVTDTIARAAVGGSGDGPAVMAVDVAEAELAAATRELADRHGEGLTVVPRAVPAVNAGDALLRYAEAQSARLLVVGNLRVKGFRRLLGSVPDDVASNAPCDVLIVKTT